MSGELAGRGVRRAGRGVGVVGAVCSEGLDEIWAFSCSIKSQFRRFMLRAACRRGFLGGDRFVRQALSRQGADKDRICLPKFAE